METRLLSATEADLMRQTIRAVQAGQMAEGVSFKAKFFALLIDPVNGDPKVFVEPNVLHSFPYAKGSGTDHLRQRILASQFLEDLKPQMKPISASRMAIGVGVFPGTKEDAEIILTGMINFGFLLKTTALPERYSFEQFANVIEAHYDAAEPRTHAVVATLRKVHGHMASL